MQAFRHTHWQARAICALLACLAGLALVATTAAARPIDPPGLYARTHHHVVAVPHNSAGRTIDAVPVSRAAGPSPDARDAAAIGAAATAVPTVRDLRTVIVHERPSATLALVLSGVALLIALGGTGYAVVSGARRDPAATIR
jgi:hypothetical protein